MVERTTSQLHPRRGILDNWRAMAGNDEQMAGNDEQITGKLHIELHIKLQVEWRANGGQMAGNF